MPYVTDQEKRDITGGKFPKTAGQLTWYLCQVILKPETLVGVKSMPAAEWEGLFYNSYDLYWKHNGGRYDQIAAVGGAMIDTRLEFKRRGFYEAYHFTMVLLKAAHERWYMEAVGAYEDTKIKENGDIFP